MIRKFLSAIIIFSVINVYPLTVASAADNIDCTKTWEDGTAEKNFCMIEDRKLKHQGGTFAQLGRNSLETLTILLASMTSMTLVVNKSDEAQKKNHVVYFANRLTPLLLLGGSVLLIFAEVESAFSFRKDCSDLLNASPTTLVGMIDAIAKKDKKDQSGGSTLVTQCNADTLKLESQIADMCRAKACTIRMKIAANKKVKHLGWAKMAYMAAASMELMNILTNMIKGGVSSALATTYTTSATTFNTLGTAAAASVYGAAGAPALFAKAQYWAGEALDENKKAADLYTYVESKDAKIRNEGLSYKKTNTFKYIVENSAESIINDQVILQIMYEKHRKAMITQMGHASSFMETAFLLDDYENLIKGRTHSLSVGEFENVKEVNVAFAKQYEGFNKLIQVSYQLAANLGVPNAQAGFNMTEIMNTLGLAAGVSLPLMAATKTTVKNLIKKAWSVPLTRVAYIGALAGLIVLDENLYKNDIVKTLDERAASFDDKIAALTPTTTMPTEPGITSDTSIAFEPPAIPTPPKTPKFGGDEVASCVTSDLSQDKNCECVDKNKCFEMKMPEISLPQGLSVPSSVASAMKNLSATANARSSGNYAKADLAGNSLSSGISAINSDYSKLKKKLDEEFSKAKKSPLDIDGASKKIQNELLKAVATAMGVPAPTNSSAPTLGSSTGGGAGSKKVEDDKAPTQTINTSNAGGTGGGAAATSEAAKTDDLGLGLDDLGTDELGKLDEAGKVAGLDAYEFKAEDISKKSDEDLFKNISSRYLKTAYPVLLKEIKATPVEKAK